MAFKSKDGKQFSNRPPMMAHNRSLEHAEKKSQSGGVDPLQQPAQHSDGMGQEDGAQIAQEHGPAMETHTMHDHEGGRHEVHSLHPDGHEHHSEHASASEAHDHAKKLSGGEQQQEPSDESQMEDAEYE